MNSPRFPLHPLRALGLAAALAFAACGQGGPQHDLGDDPPDLALPQPDLAVTLPDLSSGPPDLSGGGGDMASGGGDMASGGGDMASAVVCTSMRNWTQGNRGSQQMHPGMACVDCHRRNNGPPFKLGGTVYPTLHEPDDCAGQANAVVEITDAAGKVFSATTNANGNFLLNAAVTLPYRARVTYMGRSRAMNGAQTNGDCNSCHSVAGANNAPGRIQLP